MFQENKLTNIVVDMVYDDMDSNICNLATIPDKIHSFIGYKTATGWSIYFNISQNNNYNTLIKSDVLCYIVMAFKEYDVSDTKPVVCHMQPSTNILIKQYKPLIIKLAKEQKQRWQQLEMEDLIQMCNLVICDLVYKGYYIHKQLIRRSYNNYILMHLYKERNKPIVVSLDDKYSVSDGDNDIYIKDIIPDVKQAIERENKEDAEVEQKILSEMKEIVIDFIGPRQYDQLLRDYSNKSTTAWSRKLMTTIKAHLFEMGINRKSFNKYHN